MAKPSSPKPAPSEFSPRTETIGTLLRTAREQSGQDLRAVADALRIRYVHLLAIEEGRYDDLPGATYAVGFVRAYAEHVGLDGSEIVRRFKDEGSAIAGHSELSFPVPAAEGGIPSGALMAAALLLAGVIYGVWYWNSTTDRPFAEMIQDVPERLSGFISGKDKDAERAEEKVTEVAAEPPTVAIPQPVRGTPSLLPTERTPLASLPTTPEPAKPAEAPKAAEAAPKPAEAPKPIEAPKPAEAPKPTEASKPAETPKPVEAPKPAEAPKPVEAPKVAEVVPPPAPAPAPAVTAPPSNVSQPVGRVEVIAQAESWIQIRKGDGLVVSRLFRRGESFVVPDGSAMVLRTGNAGGTLIKLDGKALPPLGKDGDVMSGISLTPENLLARSQR